MSRDVKSIFSELLNKFLEGVQIPQIDTSLPDPDELCEETKKYE